MAEDMIKRLAVEQRKRLVASILNWCERQKWFATLTEPERQALRQQVFASAGVYHDFMLDVIKVGTEDGVVNEKALELLESVRASQRRVESRLGA